MNTKLSFQERLEILYRCIFDETQLSGKDFQYEADNKYISYDWYEPMKLFYTMFSGERSFMKCMYDIKTPDEVVIEDNLMCIARERQGVCAYCVEIDTGRVIYRDDTNNVAEPLNMQIEDFILYLIAVQSSQFCVCSGKISDCAEVLKSNYIEQRITNNSNEGAVYYFNEGVILAIIGNDAFASSKDDSFMEAFEDNTTFEVDYF